MAGEDKDLLIAYLVDVAEIDPDGDVEEQFQEWYQVREGTVSGETHYKAILDAARIRVKSFEEGRRAGLAEAVAKLGWDELGKTPGLDRSMDQAHQAED